MSIMDALGVYLKHEKVCRICKLTLVNWWKYSTLEEINEDRCNVGKEYYRVACNEMDKRLAMTSEDAS